MLTKYGAGGGNRTHTTRRSRDFESRASASFTTPAHEEGPSSIRHPSLNECERRQARFLPRPEPQRHGHVQLSGILQHRPSRQVLAGQALARDGRPRAARGGDDSFGAGVTIVNQAGAGPGARALRGPGEETLLLFARAVQQLHTYPPASPLCRQAIEAWHRLLSGSAQREPLDFRVAPAELTIDEVAVGRGTVIETELARRLHAAGIAQVTIERARVSARAHAPLPRPAVLQRSPTPAPGSDRAARRARCLAHHPAAGLPA